jgi:hypothetical protein
MSDKGWSELGNHFTTRQQMDVIFTVGQYAPVSMILNSFGAEAKGQDITVEPRNASAFKDGIGEYFCRFQNLTLGMRQ